VGAVFPESSYEADRYAENYSAYATYVVSACLSSRNWLFEPKWDGFRAICFLEKGYGSEED
jgi:hypothetical protein